MGAGKSLKNAELIFLALLTIGLMGLLFLIIYGNLSGNLGFARDTATYTNQSGGWLNQTAYVLPNGASTPGYINLTVTAAHNATGGDGTPIPAANYTVNYVTGAITNNSVITYASVNYSYVTTFRTVPERNTDAVIGNLTSGATQFFTFSNVWFILTAITILIGIVLGVIALVRRTGGAGFGGKKTGRSEFVS